MMSEGGRIEMKLKVNGQPVVAEVSADGYARLQRKWENSDMVTVDLPMRLTIQTLPGDVDEYTAFYEGYQYRIQRDERGVAEAGLRGSVA